MSADILLGIPAKLTTLLGRLTATRAGYLDNLANADTAVTNLASNTNMQTALSRLSAARAGYLDNLAHHHLLDQPTGIALGSYRRASLYTWCLGLPYFQTTLPASDVEATVGSALSGEGILSFLAIVITSSFSGTINIDYDLLLDGSSVFSGNFDVTAQYDGAVLIGGGAGNGSVGYSFTPDPIHFATSLELKCAQNNASTKTVRAFMATKKL